MKQSWWKTLMKHHYNHAVFIMFIILSIFWGGSKRLLLPPEALDPVACELRVLPARFVEPRDPQPGGDGESEILLRGDRGERSVFLGRFFPRILKRFEARSCHGKSQENLEKNLWKKLGNIRRIPGPKGETTLSNQLIKPADCLLLFIFLRPPEGFTIIDGKMSWIFLKVLDLFMYRGRDPPSASI